MKTQRQRQELTGTVVSDKMDKTIIVEAKSHVMHDTYQKVMLRRAKFVAHDEKDTAKMGDVVQIQETRPLSKTKRWKLVKVVRAAKIRPDEKITRAQRKRAKDTTAAEIGASS